MEMAVAQESCIATCGQENVFPGFSQIYAFFCQHCGEVTGAHLKPEVDHFCDLEDIPRDIRPLPHPPRCKGVPIGDCNYTGCLYGYGDVRPFTGSCHCPVCNGSGFEGEGSFQPI